MPFIHRDVFDDGLRVITDSADALHICSAKPASFFDATTAFSLGRKEGIAVGVPQDGPAGGRKVVVPPIQEADVAADGMATHWAVVDTQGERLLAAGPLAAPLPCTAGFAFTLGAIEIATKSRRHVH